MPVRAEPESASTLTNTGRWVLLNICGSTARAEAVCVLHVVLSTASKNVCRREMLRHNESNVQGQREGRADVDKDQHSQ